MNTPQRKEFRLPLIGSGDEDSFTVLGPFAMNRLDDGPDISMQDGEIILVDSETNELIKRFLIPAGDIRERLDEKLELYFSRLAALPDEVKEQFKDIIVEIKGYLKRKYSGIKPKKNHFVDWFMQKVPLPSAIVVVEKVEEESKSVLYYHVVFETPELYLTQEIIIKSLLNYCAWKVRYMDNLYDAMSVNTLQANTSLSINEKNNSGNNLEIGQKHGKNNFNDMDIEDVKKYFSQLVYSKSANGNPYMTPEQFDLFIQYAFIDKNCKAKIKINFTPGADKTAVVKLFYQYYDLCKNIGICPTRDIKNNGVKSKYLRLLTDYILGFDFENHIRVFNNSKNNNKSWRTTI